MLALPWIDSGARHQRIHLNMSKHDTPPSFQCYLRAWMNHWHSSPTLSRAGQCARNRQIASPTPRSADFRPPVMEMMPLQVDLLEVASWRTHWLRSAGQLPRSQSSCLCELKGMIVGIKIKKLLKQVQIICIPQICLVVVKPIVTPELLSCPNNYRAAFQTGQGIPEQ